MTTAAEAATAVSALSNLGGAGTIGAVVAGAPSDDAQQPCHYCGKPHPKKGTQVAPDEAAA